MINTDPRKMFLEALADLMDECNITAIVAVGGLGQGAHLEIDRSDGYAPMDPIKFEGDSIHPFEFRKKGEEEE